MNKRYPSAPSLPLLIAVQFVEVLLVVFNFLGLEHTTLVGGVTRLSDMPWSHSVATMAGYAAGAWLILAFGFRRKVLRGPSAPTNLLAVSVVALEIVITWFVVWFFARSPRSQRWPPVQPVAAAPEFASRNLARFRA